MQGFQKTKKAREEKKWFLAPVSQNAKRARLLAK
jgi:hypothetical protein